MKFVTNIYNRVYYYIQSAFLSLKQRRDRKRLKNNNFTIISNHCMGGIIYHDLGLRFLSPTINLKILPEDFVELLSHLNYYLNQEILPASEIKESFPVGKILRFNKCDYIYIYFVHYHSFEDAVAKWHDRVKRINYENLIIMMTARDGCTDETLQYFENLDYPHKVCYTLKQYPQFPHCKFARLDNGKELNGYISDMVNICGKRAFECNKFDYIEFLNKSEHINYQ